MSSTALESWVSRHARRPAIVCTTMCSALGVPLAYATSRPFGEIAASTCRPSSAVSGIVLPIDNAGCRTSAVRPATIRRSLRGSRGSRGGAMSARLTGWVAVVIVAAAVVLDGVAVSLFVRLADRPAVLELLDPSLFDFKGL